MVQASMGLIPKRVQIQHSASDTTSFRARDSGFAFLTVLENLLTQSNGFVSCEGFVSMIDDARLRVLHRFWSLDLE